MGTFFMDIELDIRKIDHMQVNRSRIPGYDPGQIDHLLSGPLAGERRRVKIYRVDLYPPFCYHIPGHRGIDAPGQQKHSFAACPHRHSSRPRNNLRIDIYFLPNLHIQQNFRFMHIHPHLRISLQKRLSQICVDLHGLLGIVLPGTPGMHLEGFIPIRMDVSYVLHHGLTELFKALILGIYHRTDTGNAKHMLQTSHGLVKIKFSLRLHIYPTLGLVNEKSSLTFFQGKFDLMNQRILKQVSVFSLDSDLGVLYQKCCKHSFPLFRLSPSTTGVFAQHRNFIIHHP